MTVRVLGNGGFINAGLPYNSLCINSTFLVEAPPDIMVSLSNHGIPYYNISRIFISHLHADHYFGMPFLVLNLFNHYLQTAKPILQIEIIGQRGLRDALLDIQQTAIAPDNPSVAFIDKLFRFVEVDASSTHQLDSATTMVFHQMNHSKPCLGFSLLNNGSYVLTYLCDTKWSRLLPGHPRQQTKTGLL